MIRLQNAIIVNNHFKEVFDKILLDIGIREPLDLNGFDSIFTFLKRNFKEMTLDEIALAFNYYSAQALDFKESHFNSFDHTFISKVLKSYKDKKEYDAKKPKIANQEEKYVWQMHEKESHFNWLKDDVFLETSERNGKRGEFPGIVIASFKDIYEYMLDQRMTIEPMGDTLKQRISACNARARVEKSDSDSFVRVVNKSDGIKTAAYYKYQVMDYFRENIK